MYSISPFLIPACSRVLSSPTTGAPLRKNWIEVMGKPVPSWTWVLRFARVDEMSASSGRNSSSRAWPGALICIVTWTLWASACVDGRDERHGTDMVAEMGEKAALRVG